jgi:hypothetical protein
VEKNLHLHPQLLTRTTWMLGAITMRIIMTMSLRDKVKRIQELRRSNAAQPVRNKKKYRRKIKHKNKYAE